MTRKGAAPALMSSGLGRRLFQARHAMSSSMGYDVTQTAVAKAIGTTGTSIGRYEAGIKVPDLEMIERLAMVLRTTPCYLAFGCQHAHTGARDITAEEAEPSRLLPAHRPRKRELASEGSDARPVPPAPIRPTAAGAAPARPAARTSAAPPRRRAR